MRRRVAVITALIALAASSCGDDATSDTGDLPAETTNTSAMPATTVAGTPTAAVEPIEISIAKASMDAWNSGDVDAYLAFFAEDAEFYKAEWSIDDEYVQAGIEYWQALGDQTLIEECEVMADGRVGCHCFGTNDLSGPAGVISESNWYFWVEDGLIVRASPSGSDLNEFWFTRDMQVWLQEAHPEVWADTFALLEPCIEIDSYNCRESWRATAETAAALLEYGPEFIAQSDKYPLGG